MRHALLLPLIAATVTGRAAAQAPAPAHDAALVIATAPLPAPAHRIFTLAWADERLPPGLARTATITVRPAPGEGDRIFTLAWQPVASGAAPALPAVAMRSGCSVMTLIAEPCSTR